MRVREEVFVNEQKCPLENEFDADDPRSCHWVVYASINETVKPELQDDEGNVTQRKKSVTTTQPIGTIRLIPFPHPPHPEPGSKWSMYASEAHVSESDQTTYPPPYIVDRETTFHDGTEPYIKLGRMAVIKEFRGHGLAKLLVHTAMTWAAQNPAYFNPSITESGMDALGAKRLAEVPAWKGLICVHAQEQVAKLWAKWGFTADEKMGAWIEEGINHVGMFNRMDLEQWKSLNNS